jgi:hypothetical protein
MNGRQPARWAARRLDGWGPPLITGTESPALQGYLTHALAVIESASIVDDRGVIPSHLRPRLALMQFLAFMEASAVSTAVNSPGRDRQEMVTPPPAASLRAPTTTASVGAGS